MSKKSILICLYGNINSDNRVKNSIFSLQKQYEISLIIPCIMNNKNKDLKVHEIKNKNFKTGPFNYIKYLIFVLKIISKTKYDIIYVHDYYLSITVFSKLFLKSKFIYDAHELIIDQSFKKDPRTYFFKLLEKISINFFDLVIAANQERLKIMIEYYNLKKQFGVVRNIPIIDLNGLDQSKLDKKFQFMNEHKKFIVYQGVLSKKRKIESILSIFLQKKKYNIIVAGGGNKKYVDILKNRFKENFFFVGKVERLELYYLLKKSCAGIISYGFDDLNNTYCAPNKLYEYSFFNLPMLTTKQILFYKTFQNYPIGLVVDTNFNFENFEKLLNDRSLNNYFNNFNKRFNNKNESSKLLKMVNNLFIDV